MLTHKCALSTLVLTAAMAFGATAIAADLPKEGTFTATYSAVGTTKSSPLGEARWFGSWDEDGLSVGSGLFDHFTWHCWGVSEGMKAIGTVHGYCLGTDPTGDQIATEDISDGKVDLTKPFTVASTFTGGTGKYAGISGKSTDDCHGPEFKMPEGRYVQYCPTIKGSYKLP